MTEFCEQQAIQHPTLSDKYSQLSELFSRKLWHQLTVAVYDFVQDDANSQGDSFIRLYTDFIAKFEARINQLKLAQILCAVARKFADPADAAALLSSALEKSARLGPEPSLLLSSELGLTNLRRGMAEGVKEQLAKDKAALEDLEGVADTSVHSAHHLLACEYYKGVGPPEAFFRSALMYLAYTPLESMAAERQQQLATDISLAAITGDGVYNFGEVVATAAVKALAGTPNAWLGELLDAFNRGDIDAFNAITADHQAAIASQPVLATRAEFVKEKMALMCLVNMVFERSSHERDFPFAEVAKRTRLPLDQVEWLVMRAMSQGLVRGVMDEVAQVVHVTWVQPRVLDRQQIGHLEARLESWKTSVGSALQYMETQTPELFG
ncbi:26S proteasome subunit like protein [Tribonema minus]|uniref:26S proteasome subunit like protein n=1 Tax=Tribonema minus TaxID=303371 RepID=A0A836CML5_9STRA|nr:26S proteasome subunit like protein [Tribonema minus]